MNQLTPERREQLERAKEKLQEFLKKDPTLIKLKEIAELQKETNQLLSDTKSDTAFVKEIKELKEELKEKFEKAIEQKPPIVNVPDNMTVNNLKDIEFDEVSVNNLKDIQFPKQKEVEFPEVQDVKVVNTNKNVIIENTEDLKQKEVEVINFPEQKEVKFPDNQNVTIINPKDIKQRKVSITNLKDIDFPEFPNIPKPKDVKFPDNQKVTISNPEDVKQLDVKAEVTNLKDIDFPEVRIPRQKEVKFPDTQKVKLTDKIKTEITNLPKKQLVEVDGLKEIVSKDEMPKNVTMEMTPSNLWEKVFITYSNFEIIVDIERNANDVISSLTFTKE